MRGQAIKLAITVLQTNFTSAYLVKDLCNFPLQVKCLHRLHLAILTIFSSLSGDTVSTFDLSIIGDRWFNVDWGGGA